VKKLLGISAYLVKKLWLTLAVLLVLFAVLLSLLRISLPHLQDKKYLLEDYLQSQYGVSLTLESVHAVWQGTGPSIVLNNVKLAQNESSPVELKIAQVYVEVDFWQSILQRSLSSKRFDLVGLELAVDSQRVEQGGDGDYPVVDALRSLFLDQLQSFSLQDGEVKLISPEDTQVVSLSQLVWVNKGDRHQGRGEIRVKELTKNSASFILDLYGERSDLKGVFYAKGEEVDVSPWLNAWLPTKLPLVESRGNFEIWANLGSDKIDSLQMEFSDSQIGWRIQDDSLLQTHIKGGSIQAQPVEQGWSLRVDQLILEADSSSMVTDFVGKLDGDNTFTINTVKPVDLSPVMSLAPLFTATNTGEVISRLSPKADLATLQLQIKNKQVSVAAKILNLQWQQDELIPGLTALDTSFYWHKDHGVLQVNKDSIELHSSNLFANDIHLDQLRGKAFIYPDESVGWVVLVKDMLVANEDLHLSQDIRYEVDTGDLSVATRVGSIAVAQVPLLFPAPLMGANTVKYLTSALPDKGKVTGASMIWQGNPSQFPFADHSGVFMAQLDVTDSAFTFAPDWPALTDVNMGLVFENDSLVMTSPKSHLMDVVLTDIRARIPKLTSSSILTIDANGAGTGAQLTALMQNSGIKNTLGKTLAKGVVVSGDVKAKVNLSIPLQGRHVVASGTAILNDNNVTIPSLNLALTNVSGELEFKNADIHTKNVTAKIQAQPIAIGVQGKLANDTYLLDIGVEGQGNVTELVTSFNPDLAADLDGSTEWNAKVSVSLPAEGFAYTASLNSTLVGVASNLPMPFNKGKADKETLMLTVDGDQQASNISMTLGDDIRFNGVLAHQEKQFSRAHLSLGDTDFVGMGVGFSISADVPIVNVSDWYKTIEVLINSGHQGQGPSLFKTPERIYISTKNLIIAEQTLSDVSLHAKHQADSWLLDVVSDQAKAQVTLHDNWLEDGIQVDADFIHFNDWQASETAKKHEWLPENMPPIRFHCGDCIVLEKDLGVIDLDIAKHADGMEIKQLEATNKFGKLRAQGMWVHSSDGVNTELNGSLKSSDIGRMLEEFGVNTSVKDSEASMKFSVNWADTPLDFNYEDLNGSLDWKLTDGYLADVSDKGSRIFTLFSLNSLVRKLSLDFRDVFAKGFFYDAMKGSMQIEQGIAHTNDTVIDGGAGEIEIQGYTDLVASALNYNVSFTPNVTGSLPFLVYFMVNPPTALAALALDQVLTSAKVISNVNYRVTGTFDAPVFEEVGRDSKDIPLPARNVTPAENDLDNESLNPLELNNPEGSGG
jgi:uncharacterized protein (TIGR02099 family)